MLGVPESDIAKTLRDFEVASGLGDMEITTCLRKGEMEILVSHPPEDRGRRDELMAAFEAQYGRAIFSESEETVDQQIVRLLAGRTLVMKYGRVIESGLTDQILEDPQHAYSQRLVAAAL